VEPLVSLILALDTATPAVTAGIVRLGGSDWAVLAERVTVDARAHAERLTPNVLAALADAALTMSDLDAVVVGCGPGPFTGLRAASAAWTPLACEPAATPWWSPMPVGERSTGRDTATDSARTARQSTRRPTSIPERRGQWRARRSTPLCSSCRDASRSTRRRPA